MRGPATEAASARPATNTTARRAADIGSAGVGICCATGAVVTETVGLAEGRGATVGMLAAGTGKPAAGPDPLDVPPVRGFADGDALGVALGDGLGEGVAAGPTRCWIAKAAVSAWARSAVGSGT
jgi:hypothetical protein